MVFKRCWFVALALCLSLLSQEAGRTGIYQDDRIQVDVPAGWTYKPVYLTVSGDQTYQQQVGVVLSDGPFELYLLTHYGHASGVIGGRFGEIATYVAPWIKDESPSHCIEVFQLDSNPVSRELVRTDLVLDSAMKIGSNDTNCQTIKAGGKGRFWAGAYFGYPAQKPYGSGFFVSYPLSAYSGCGSQMVFTASFRTNGPENLPAEDDARVKKFLAEADKVVAGISYK
jgi:hypothetical protein